MRMSWTVPLLLIPLAACDLLGPTSYRLDFQLIEANGPGKPDPRIADVVDELRKTFPFEGYALGSEFSIAVKPDTEFTKSTGTGTDDPRIVYTFNGGFQTAIDLASPDGDETLRLRVERGAEPVLETTVGIRPGQTLVLGSMPRNQEATLLIVVRMVES